MTTDISSSASTHGAEKILLVVHDAIKRGLGADSVGDIVLTDRHIFIFTFIQETDPLAMGGAVGGALSAVTEKNRYIKFRQATGPYREALNGLRIEDRAARKTLYRTIAYTPSQDIKISASTADKITLKTPKGTFAYFVPPMPPEVMAAINAWPNSPALYDTQLDPDGFFVGSASPTELMSRLAQGDAEAASEIYTLCKSRNYLSIVFTQWLIAEEASRNRMLNVFSTAPLEFRHALLAKADELSRQSRKTINVSSIILVIGVFLAVVAISSPKLMTILLSLIVIAFTIFGLVFANRRLKIARQISAVVQAKGVPVVKQQVNTQEQGQPLCPNCGKQTRAGDLFCEKCGTKL